MGLFIAAAIATLIVVLLLGAAILRLAPASARPALAVAALATLPLSPLVYHLVRLPLDGVLKALLGGGPAYLFTLTLYAPVTEEPAKWLVLAIPLVLRALDMQTALPLALAAGLGFGVGEIWFLAWLLHVVPDYAALPFWMFQGFVIERVVVTFLHGAFVALLFRAVAGRRGILLAGLAGIGLHYLLNLPIFLASQGALGIEPARWTTIASLWPLLMAASLGIYLAATVSPPKRAGDNSDQS